MKASFTTVRVIMPEPVDDNRTPPTRAQVAKYEMLSPMLDSALNEMREFSKKKQEGIVNKTKIDILNRLLRDMKELLTDEPSNEYLDLLDEDMVPQNSDAVLILGQYRAAMNRFKNRHFRRDSTGLGGKWVTREEVKESGGKGKVKNRR
jgi:hypothetical protein